MIRAFKLMDGNPSIEKFDNSNIEQCENNEGDKTIQDSKFIRSKPKVSDEPYSSLSNMLVLMNIESEQKIAHPETSIIKDNTCIPYSFSLTENLYFFIIN